MAIPRVFISSTCYDLKYIRENLKYFVRSLGYEPVLSEEGAIFYDPVMHVQDACLAEVPNCQLFVLVIGGRFGSAYKETAKSITNHEFLEAAKSKIPIFALVEQGVYEHYSVYKANRGNKDINADKVFYPSVDSPRIFDFIGEVQNQSVNNALVPFAYFDNMEAYLKQQWANMFQRLLASQNERSRAADLLEEIANTNKKIEYLSRQVLSAVGSPIDQLKAKAYDFLINQSIAHDLNSWSIRITPDIFLLHSSLDELCQQQIKRDSDEDADDDSFSITHGGPPYRASRSKLTDMRSEFNEARTGLLQLLESKGVTVDKFLNTANN